MTFDEIVTAVAEELNLTTSAAITRIGKRVNTRYKRVTTVIGLNVTRRATVQNDCSVGVQTVTFTAIEKIVAIRNESGDVLPEVTVDEIRNMGTPAATNDIRRWALLRSNSDTVEILLDVLPQSTGITLFADGFAQVSTLSGTNEPAFPESFHDILIFGAIADELRKKQQYQNARMNEADFEKRLGELRLFIAASNSRELYQGKHRTEPVSMAGSGGSGSPNGLASYTQSGLITFDRDPLAPFAVTSGSAAVPNLKIELAGLPDSAGLSVLGRTGSGTGVRADITAGTTGQVLKRVSSSSLIFTTATIYLSKSDTGALNNYDPSLVGDTVIILTGAAPALTGLVAGYQGQRVKFISGATTPATFAHNSGSSSVGNRFINPTTTAVMSIVAAAGTSPGWIEYIYDGSQWVCTGHEQGAWLTAPFAAGDYTAAGAATWTVAAGDANAMKYILKGRTLLFSIYMSTTTVVRSGGDPTNLIIASGQWGGFTPSSGTASAGYALDNGIGIGVLLQTSGSNVLVQRFDAAQWANSTDATYILGQLTMQVT